MNQSIRFDITLWPIIRLNLLGLVVVFLLILAVAIINGISLEDLGIRGAGAMAYFALGLFILLIIASLLSWKSGPDVYVQFDGIRIETAWMRDRAFVRRREFFLPWHEMSEVHPERFFTMPYLKIIPSTEKTPLYVPLFLTDSDRFRQEVLKAAPSGNPLLLYFENP